MLEELDALHDAEAEGVRGDYGGEDDLDGDANGGDAAAAGGQVGEAGDEGGSWLLRMANEEDSDALTVMREGI